MADDDVPTEMQRMMARQAAFDELRPVCARLLLLRTKPAELHEALVALDSALHHVDSRGLAACWDYVTMPLNMMLDSYARSRTKAPANGPPSAAASTRATDDSDIPVPAIKSDRVAEALLKCVLALLQRCVSEAEEDQLTAILLQLAPCLAVPYTQTSEETRLYLCQCFSALMPTDPAVYTPACNEPQATSALERQLQELGLGDVDTSEWDLSDPVDRVTVATQQSVRGPCALRKALRRDTAAPTVGYLIHNFLSIAEREAATRATDASAGSLAVCGAALTALHGLVIALSCAESLAFFIPGLASNLCKTIRALSLGTVASGSVGVPTATAILTLTNVLTLTLNDTHLTHNGITHSAITAPRQVAAPSTTSTTQEASEEASEVATAELSHQLQQLQSLVANTQSTQPTQSGSSTSGSSNGPLAPGHNLIGNVLGVAQSSGTVASDHSIVGSVSGLTKGGSSGRTGPSQGAGPQSFRVSVTVEWVVSTVDQVMRLWDQAVRPLLGSAKASVRAALATGTAQLLQRCSLALSPAHRTSLLDTLLALAQDDSAKVSKAALAALQGPQQPTAADNTPHTRSTSNGASSTVAPAQVSVSLAGPVQASAGTEGSGAAGSVGGSGSLNVPEAHTVAVSGSVCVPEALVDQLTQGLWPALRAGSQQAVLHARKLTSALLLMGLDQVVTQLLQKPSRVSALVSVLVRCFVCDVKNTSQVLTMKSVSGAVAGTRFLGASSDAAACGSTTNKDPPVSTQPTTASSTHTQHHSQTPTAGISTPATPRPPLLPQYLTTHAAYESVASVARVLGYLANLADEQNIAGSKLHLRRLMDVIVSHIHDATSHLTHHKTTNRTTRHTSKPGPSSNGLSGIDAAGAGGDVPWQATVSAAVGVAGEVLYGAAPGCWTPPYATAYSRLSDTSTGPSAGVLACAALLVECTIESGTLTGLPTHNPQPGEQGAGDTHSDRHSLTVLGLNALTVRSVLDLTSVIARVLGPSLRDARSAAGRLTRPLLIAAVERSADACTVVAAAAADALVCLAVCGGYVASQSVSSYRGALRALLGANADYVIDSVCLQLRDLPSHPRAPQLLAAMLGSGGGVAPALLPAMAEPLSRALGGVSVLSRRASPQHVYPFALVLSEVAKGAAEAAADAAAVAKQAQEALKARVETIREKREARFEAAAAAARPAGATDGAGAGDEPTLAAGGTASEARAYFMARAADQDKSKAQPNDSYHKSDDPDSKHGTQGTHDKKQDTTGDPNEGDMDEDTEGWLRGVMTLMDIQEADERFRLLHGAAVAAGAVADAASPLLVSQDLRVAVVAMRACASALSALGHTTPALDTDSQLIEELAPRGLVRPVQPQSPKVLPSIAALWPFLIQSLSDPRTPLVEEALTLLAEVIREGGGAFMARRFANEAAPLLGVLLAKGTAASRASNSGARRSSTSLFLEAGDTRTNSNSEEGSAEGALTRVRVAALGCIAAVCSCKGALAAVKAHTWGLAQACIPFLATSHPAPLRQAAVSTLKTIANIDPDTVWLLLQDIQQCQAALGVHTHDSTEPRDSHPPTLPAGLEPLISVKTLLPLPDWARKKGRAADSVHAGKGSVGGAVPLPPAQNLASGNLPWPVTNAVALQCGEEMSELVEYTEAVRPAYLDAVPVVARDHEV